MYELTQLQDEFLVAEAQPEAAVHSVQGDGLLSAPAAAWPA
jgi:hypothetical protein